MTSPTAEDDHLLDEDNILVPETQLESPNTFSQKIIKRLCIRSIIRKVDAATPSNNTDYDNNEAGPSGVASLPNKALISIDQHLTTPLGPILKIRHELCQNSTF